VELSKAQRRARFFAKRTQPNPRVLYGVLAVTIAIAFVVPESALLQLAVVPRFVVAVAIAFGPVFCANLVFAERFEMVERPTVAFGANLLGAMMAGRSSTPRSSPGTELSSSPRRFSTDWRSSRDVGTWSGAQP
jgi:hypothetical protein